MIDLYFSFDNLLESTSSQHNNLTRLQALEFLFYFFISYTQNMALLIRPNSMAKTSLLCIVIVSLL